MLDIIIFFICGAVKTKETTTNYYTYDSPAIICSNCTAESLFGCPTDPKLESKWDPFVEHCVIWSIDLPLAVPLIGECQD